MGKGSNFSKTDKELLEGKKLFTEEAINFFRQISDDDNDDEIFRTTNGGFISKSEMKARGFSIHDPNKSFIVVE